MSGAPVPAPRLSVLDQSPVGAGFSPADSLRGSVELAHAAEETGHMLRAVGRQGVLPA